MERSARSADPLAKTLNFIVTQKLDFFKLVHTLIVHKGLGCSFGESNAGHKPAHHSIVHGGVIIERSAKKTKKSDQGGIFFLFVRSVETDRPSIRQ